LLSLFSIRLLFPPFGRGSVFTLHPLPLSFLDTQFGGHMRRWKGPGTAAEWLSVTSGMWFLTTCRVALEPCVLELRAYCFHAAFDIEQK
jgi:hypothetical protein